MPIHDHTSQPGTYLTIQFTAAPFLPALFPQLTQVPAAVPFGLRAVVAALAGSADEMI